ncbi:hypothetical protein LCGC14_0937500 [marine sediment metagenome]|uniref:Uncharacterized protein n=1 Tax=marine sediment metagenome TaxID=412755 RepID=A0A0F9NL67_9ZZZZ
MKTITIQIGNSDDKLRQAEWAYYVQAVKLIVANFACETHFFGGSAAWESWQNMAWVIVPLNDDLQEFKEALTVVRQNFNQESMAFAVGETIFL